MSLKKLWAIMILKVAYILIYLLLPLAPLHLWLVGFSAWAAEAFGANCLMAGLNLFLCVLISRYFRAASPVRFESMLSMRILPTLEKSSEWDPSPSSLGSEASLDIDKKATHSTPGEGFGWSRKLDD